MMKTLFSALLLVLSLNSNAAGHFDTAGLTALELQIIGESSAAQLKALESCLNDHGTKLISETSCINEVFGDIHN